MRIGLMIPSSIDTISGGYLYDRMLVEHLRHEGHHVEVISGHTHTYTRNLLNNFSLELVKKLKAKHFDVLLQDELAHPSLFLLNKRIKEQTLYPLISIVHHLHCDELHTLLQNRLYRWIEQRYLQTIDGFIFNSETTRNEVEKLLFHKLPSIVAYPCGSRFGAKITEKESRERASQPGPLRILFLGNVIPRKQLHVLIAALRRMPANDFLLTVIGNLEMDKSYANKILQSVKKDVLANNVTFLGAVSDNELVKNLKKAHVLAVPSSYEGFGIVYLEGMGFGLPAIASSAGGTGEIITHGKDGFLVPVGDDAALASYLNEIHHDREKLAEMSLNACRRYQRHPTWQKTCEDISRFLQNLAQPAAIK